MAKRSLNFILTLALVIAYSAAPLTAYTGGLVGGRTKVKDVEDNKEIQELGQFSVNEYNRMQHDKGSGENGAYGGDLMFRQVVEAETQVVSGIKYYLKILATTPGGASKTFDAVVVVQAWKKSKQLLNFGPSPAN